MTFIFSLAKQCPLPPPHKQERKIRERRREGKRREKGLLKLRI